MKNSKIVKTAIVTSFTGLASIPALFYALVVRQVQTVEGNTAMSTVKQDKVLKSADNTGKLLFALGLFFLVVLIGFIVIGVVAREREAQDNSGA